MIVGTSPSDIIEWLLDHWAREGCRAAAIILLLILACLSCIVHGVVSYILSLFAYTMRSNG